MLTTDQLRARRTFDVRPCRGCTLDDLVPDLFRVGYLPAAVDRAVIAENERADEEQEEQMASLRFYDLAAGCPTHAGALLFARDPLRWVAGAWIQFVRWDGTTMADDPIAERRFSGDLITVLREVEAFVSLPVRARPVAESALRERTAMDYPPAAIRELLLNAIMHRSYESNAPVRFYWYDDRIDIQNPGGLYGMASPENFPRQTDYRNPVVSEALATLGYVNAFGARRYPRAGGVAQERQPGGGVHVRTLPRAGHDPQGAVKTTALFDNEGGSARHRRPRRRPSRPHPGCVVALPRTLTLTAAHGLPAARLWR